MSAPASIDSQPPFRAWRALACVLAASAIVLTACGGGGGGSGNGDGDGPDITPPPGGNSPPPADVPMDPPAPPVVTYTGARNPATFTEANAAMLGDLMWDAVSITFEIANDMGPASLGGEPVVDETTAGPGGGSAHITGRDGDHAWLQTEFFDYVDGGVRWNGTEVVERVQTLTSDRPLIERVTFYALRQTGADYDVTYSGRIERELEYDYVNDSSREHQRVSATWELHDSSGAGAYFEDMSIERQEILGGYETTASGRAYDFANGLLDVSTTHPLSYAPGDDAPRYGGPLVAAGLDGRALELDAIAPTLRTLSYATAADGPADRSARFTWDTYCADQLAAPMSPPLANAGRALYARPGDTLTLDARYGESGGAFDSFEWKQIGRAHV